MSNDNTGDNENEQLADDTALIEREAHNNSEKESDIKCTILTLTEKSKIKFIKNSDCKSWTYHKGDLL